MHILFLTDNFPPEVNAPASRTFEHCRAWFAHGHKVTVITCAPNFPAGRLFPGYKNRIWQVEIMDGIRVIRVWTYITSNDGFVKRIVDYLSFMVSGAVAAIFVQEVDIVIGTSPQFFTVCAAYITSIFKRAPWVFELRDIWPDSIKAVGAMKESLATKMLDKLVIFLYHRANLIVTVSHSFLHTLVNLGVSESKIAVITNGVDLSRFRKREKDPDLLLQYDLDKKYIVGYVGTHGMAHGLEVVLKAAEILEKKMMIRDVKFLFIGDGAKKQELINNAKKKEISNIIFLDSVPKDLVAKYWSLLDVSIIHLRKSPLFYQVIPSKLFESMGMGIPILHGVPGESARIVEKENVGELFDSENVDQLISCLLRLRNDRDRQALYQKNCLDAAYKYDRSSLAKEMLNLMLKIVE
jgi:hypothetical protein